MVLGGGMVHPGPLSVALVPLTNVRGSVSVGGRHEDELRE
jgi:hypothetical protein